MQPCEQAPTIHRVESKIDKLFEAVASIAVQNQRIDLLEQSSKDHEGRIRTIEAAPLKRMERMAWMVVGGIGSIGAAVLVAIVTFTIGSAGTR